MMSEKFSDSIFTDFVEAMLPTFSGKLALRMILDIRLSYYSNDNDITVGRYVDVVFNRPNNYTKVYTRISEDSHFSDQPIWFKQSDHDSCWRTDGLRFFNKVNRELSDLLEKQGAAYHEMHSFISFYLFSGKPHYTTLEKQTSVSNGNEKTAFPKYYRLELGPELSLNQIIPYLTKSKVQTL